MNDERLIELYWTRDENAIIETDNTYGKYCHTIAKNILNSESDSEECINDTYMSVWQSIPPTRPTCFRAYIAKITRNIAMNMLDYFKAKKRHCESATVMDEFWECIPSPEDSIVDDLVLREAINGFLASLKKEHRIIFMRRYWHFSSVREIARSRGLSEANVKVILLRTRRQFREYLKRREITV